MLIVGIDFTSSPSRRKPITAQFCEFGNNTLRVLKRESWGSFEGFESFLSEPGPWIAGIDFPFGFARRFLTNQSWSLDWAEYVQKLSRMDREQFREMLNDYRSQRLPGDKEHQRAIDKLAGGVSPQKLYGVPVALMLFEGAPRLLRAGVSVLPLHETEDNRIVLESYPGVLVRSLMGRVSYKNDNIKKQTNEHKRARVDALRLLTGSEFAERVGFKIIADESVCEDPSGDEFDALVCAVQAAWGYRNRGQNFSIPNDVDHSEGWIVDPSVSERVKRGH